MSQGIQESFWFLGADPSDKNLLREIGVTQSIHVDMCKVILASVTGIA